MGRPARALLLGLLVALCCCDSSASVKDQEASLLETASTEAKPAHPTTATAHNYFNPWFDPFSLITAHMNFGHYALIQAFGVEAKSREMIKEDLKDKPANAKSSARFIWPYPWPHDPFIAPTAISMGMY